MVGKPSAGGVKKSVSPSHNQQQWFNYILREGVSNNPGPTDIDYKLKGKKKTEEAKEEKEGKKEKTASKKKEYPYNVQFCPYLDVKSLLDHSVDLLVTDIPYNVSLTFIYFSFSLI